MRSSGSTSRLACGVGAFCLILTSPLLAQSLSVNELKAKIFDARMAQKTFANGLPFCKELDGSNFYFEPRHRVLNLEEYHQSLDNLAKAQAYNPEKRRPWSAEDANSRWEQVKKQAVQDEATCKLVAGLPEFEKRLEELQHKPEGQKKTQ